MPITAFWGGTLSSMKTQFSYHRSLSVSLSSLVSSFRSLSPACQPACPVPAVSKSAQKINKALLQKTNAAATAAVVEESILGLPSVTDGQTV